MSAPSPQRGFGIALCAAVLLAASSAPSALGSVTIGQLPPGPVGGNCGAGSSGNTLETLQPTVTSGASYVVPPMGVKITSWSTQANELLNQGMKMKVYRPLMGLSYVVVGHDGPFHLTPSQVNTFATDLAVQPGDVLGLSVPRPFNDVACGFAAPGERYLQSINAADTADGASATFAPVSGLRDNISAQVALETGQRAAALKKCKKKHSHKKRKKCRKKANKLPV
jgi:hypothetical protein